MLGGFFFELRHALHLADIGKAVEYPRQFRMRRDKTLSIDKRVRIVDVQSRSDKIFEIFESILIERAVINRRRETM